MGMSFTECDVDAAAIVSRKAHEANKGALKSDMKKGTAFVKKIRGINSEGENIPIDGVLSVY